MEKFWETRRRPGLSP